MSRSAAKKSISAYKDVEDVAGATVDAGLAAKVARLRPMGVIKG